MRHLLFGILIGGIAAAGCDRTSRPAADTTAESRDTRSTDTPGAANPEAPAAAAGDRSLVDKLLGRRDVVIPAGTALTVVLDTAVGSDTSKLEEPVRAHLSAPLTIDGVEVLAKESAVTGVVTVARRAGKTKGRSQLGLKFNSLVPSGSDERYAIDTAAISRSGASERKKDAVKIGAPAAGGAIIGGIVGGKKGAVVGGAIGGGAGTAVVLTDRGPEVRLAPGATLTVRLAQPVTVRVRS